MYLLLDSGVLGVLCHTSRARYQPLETRLWKFIRVSPVDHEVFIPEIADYEVRRKLLHMISKSQTQPESIARLDSAAEDFTYLPIDTPTMLTASEFWAEARRKGRPTASDLSLDADMILAAQAHQVGGTVVTTNRKHLSQFVPTIDWTEIPTTA